MKKLIAAVAAFAALPLFAQNAQTDPGKKPVAIINGETITAEKLDQLYDRLGTKLRTQYDSQGGKPAYLENYLRKRLLVQEAIKHGFDQVPDVKADMQASAEATLFDRYVRDVVSQSILTEDEMKKFYDDNVKEFAIPEKVKIRHIIIVPMENGPNKKTKGEALERIEKIAAELHGQNVFPAGTSTEVVERLVGKHFQDAAKKYSEDGAAQNGGDLGWVSRGVLDPKFEEAAFLMKKGTMSGIVETKFGYHLIFIEDRKAATTEPYETAKPQIREFLMTQHATEVLETVKKLTNELERNSKTTTFPENIR